MKKKENIVWVLVAIAVISLAFKYSKKKGSVTAEPLDKGEFPLPGNSYFPSDIPDYQD